VDQTPETHEERGSTFLAILNWGLLPLFLTAVYFGAVYVLKHDFQNCDCKPSKFLVSLINQSWNFETKFSVVLVAWMSLAALVLLCTVLVMLLRVVMFRPQPYKQADPLIIAVLNRVIANTIEQSFVFIPFFSFWVLTKLDEAHKFQAVSVLTLFVAGRAVFFVGYLVQWLTNIFPMRAAGFFTTLICHALVISKVLGCDVTETFLSFGNKMHTMVGK